MPEEINCPIDCPNRKKDIKTGKFTVYFFTLIVVGFLAFSCVSYERRGEFIPVSIWFPCLTLSAMGLGVQIDPAIVGAFVEPFVQAFAAAIKK